MPGHRLAESEAPPAALQAWLLDQGSLTERLRETFGERLNLKLLHRGYESARADEARALGLDRGETVLLRRVLLAVDGHLVVLGRAVIPQETLNGEGERLAQLDDQPLGEVAFVELGARRERLEITRLETGSALFPELTESAWARRSILISRTGPVLVTEAFLPALLELLD